MTEAQAKLKRNFLLIALLITGLVSAIIGVLAYFGLNMGTFVISLDESAYRSGLALSETPDFKASYPRLLVKPVSDTLPVTYEDLRIDEIKSTDGNFLEKGGYTYLAYTFYLKNVGNTTVNYSFNINVTEVTKNLDEAVRVMLIQDDEIETVFIKEDETCHEYLSGELGIRETTPDENIEFFDSEIICESEIDNFKPEDIRKYSVVIWLEGWDPECVGGPNVDPEKDKMGGQIKMDMTFAIVSSYTDDKQI